MPVRDALKVKRGIEELAKACVIAGHRAGKLVQQVPALATDLNDAMTAFNSAFQSLRKATAKLAVLDKGDEVEDQNQA
jgi:ABC-type transporter Mla subunit MlaD